MRKTFVVFVLAVLVVASPRARAEEEDPEPRGRVGPELRQLRGKWVGTRKALGKKGDKAGTPVSYEFKGDKVTVTNGATTYEATAKLITRDNPARLMLL